MVAISSDAILDTIRDSLLVLDEDLRVQSANRSFYKTFAVAPEQTEGRLIYELGDGQWDIPALRTLLSEIVPRESTIEAFEVRHVFPTIGRKVMKLNARKVFRADDRTAFLLLAIDDVTDAQDAIDERERIDRLTQNIVDTIRDPLVVLEDDMTVVMASRSFLELFDVPPVQVVGRSLYDLAQGQWRVPRLQELMQIVIPDDTAIDGFEIEDEFPGLGQRIFKLNARKVFRPGNHVTRLLLVIEDVTEARLLERHRDMLAAEMAHRVKNSLQTIAAFVAFEMRRAANESKEGFRVVQARIAAVTHLYDLISRSATLGPVPIGPYLEGIAENLKASLLGDSSAVSIRVDTEPRMIGTDHAVAIGLIVNELATNAIKHAFPTAKGEIIIGFFCHETGCVLSVNDNGIGLDAAMREPARSGLGSRFVDAFVRQIGGTLKSTTGSFGTTFTVDLPRSVLAADAEVLFIRNECSNENAPRRRMSCNA